MLNNIVIGRLAEVLQVVPVFGELIRAGLELGGSACHGSRDGNQPKIQQKWIG